MDLGMRRRGLCSDGSWPETDPSAGVDVRAKQKASSGDWHEHTVKRSAFATIPAETRAFIIIDRDASLLLVTPPCDSWLQSLQHLTLQPADPAAHDAAARHRDAVDATHACNSTSHWTLHPVDVATATPST